ncbi:MAG: hypothetical protein ACRCXT_12705 [Paraclostridium sp.]
MELKYNKIVDTIEYMEKNDLWQVVYVDGLFCEEVEVTLGYAQDGFDRSYSLIIDEKLEVRCCDKELFIETVRKKYKFSDIINYL